MDKIKKNIKKVIKLVKLDEMEFLPGHLAFYLMFLIIPIISFVGILISKFHISSESLIINHNIPNVIINLIDESINYNNFNIYIFLIVSLWIASRGAKGIIIANNLLFKIKEKDSLKIRIRAIILVVILFDLIIFMVIVPVLGDFIIHLITNHLSDSGINLVTNIYNMLKYPLSIILMFILIKTIYTLSFNQDIKGKYVNKGAIFTTILWLFLSRIYSLYLNNFNTYSLYYGSLSVFLILLIWVYLLSYIFIIGMALNANYYLNCKKEEKSD